MDIFENYTNKKNSFTRSIRDSRYIEGNAPIKQVIKGSSDISEIIVGSHEIEYSVLESEQKSQFVMKKKLEIASNITLGDKYHKKFSRTLLQTGFQQENHFSTIQYLNEHYHIHCIIYNQDTQKYYKTCLNISDKTPFYIKYHKNMWFGYQVDSEPVLNEYGDYNDLQTILTMDISPLMVYKPYLQSISKYKVSDLEVFANDMKIPRMIHEKKKTKQQLFDDINLKHINNQ